MKINIQKIARRTTPILTAVVVVLCCLSFPASAVENGVIKWEDLPHSSAVSGDSVTYTLDLTGIGKYYLVRTNPYQAWELGDNPNYVIDTSGIYQFDFTTDSFSFDPLFFSQSQSDFNFSWRIQGDYGAIGHVSSSLVVRYFDSSGKRLGSEQFTASPADDSGEAWHVSFDPAIPANTASINFSCLFDFSVEALGLVSVSFPLRYFNYSFTVSADSVQNKQIQDKLNNILDGTPEQNEQADQFRDELDGAIGDLNNAGDIMADVPKPDIAVGDLVPSDILNGTHFLTYTATIGEFWNSGILSSFTTVLGGLLLLSYVLFGEKG